MLKLSAENRERLVDYIASDLAERWSMDTGCDEGLLYALFRKVPAPEWKTKALDDLTDEELVEHYMAAYDLDTVEHEMDAFVVGLVHEWLGRAFPSLARS